MARTTRHLELSIEVDSDPISGSVSNGAHELVGAIEAARSPVAGPGGSGQTDAETLGSAPGAKAQKL